MSDTVFNDPSQVFPEYHEITSNKAFFFAPKLQQQNGFLNSVYALNISIEHFLASHLLQGDLSRVIYSSNSYAFRERDRKNSGNLNIPFVSYYVTNIEQETSNRRLFSNQANVDGVTLDVAGVLGAKLRLVPVTISYEVTAYYSQHKDAQIAYSELMLSTSNETIFYGDISIQGDKGAKEVISLSIINGCLTNDIISITLPSTPLVSFAMTTSEDTPIKVADKIRQTTFPGWVLSGTDTTIVFTNTAISDIDGDSIIDFATTGITGIISIDTYGRTSAVDTSLKNPAFIYFNPEFNPEFQESEWLEQNDILTIVADFTAETYFCYTSVPLYVTKETAFNFCIAKDLISEQTNIKNGDFSKVIWEYYNR